MYNIYPFYHTDVSEQQLNQILTEYLEKSSATTDSESLKIQNITKVQELDCRQIAKLSNTLQLSNKSLVTQSEFGIRKTI